VLQDGIGQVMYCFGLGAEMKWMGWRGAVYNGEGVTGKAGRH